MAFMLASEFPDYANDNQSFIHYKIYQLHFINLLMPLHFHSILNKYEFKALFIVTFNI